MNEYFICHSTGIQRDKVTTVRAAYFIVNTGVLIFGDEAHNLVAAFNDWDYVEMNRKDDE